jgi:hypothetical protein
VFLRTATARIDPFGNPRRLIPPRLDLPKCGNTHARRVLTEAAWAFQLPARVTPIIVRRQDKLPKNIRTIAWKAQVRLFKRYRTLCAKGKEHKKSSPRLPANSPASSGPSAREVPAVALQCGLPKGAALRAREPPELRAFG